MQQPFACLYGHYVRELNISDDCGLPLSPAFLTPLPDKSFGESSALRFAGMFATPSTDPGGAGVPDALEGEADVKSSVAIRRDAMASRTFR